MKADKKTKLTRWGVILAISLILLFTAGAIYAQGGMRQGFNRGGGPGMGSGGPGGPGMGPMMLCMQDEEIRNLVAQITFISRINKLELSHDQVETLLECARDAREIVDEEFDDLKDDLRDELRNQLDSVVDGAEFDPAVMQEFRDQYSQSHEPEAIREELQEVLDRAIDILTEEQREQLMEGMGPRAGEMRERFQGRFGGERMGEMRGQAARGRIMMMLLSPQSIEAFELWLSSN